MLSPGCLLTRTRLLVMLLLLCAAAPAAALDDGCGESVHACRVTSRARLPDADGPIDAVAGPPMPEETSLVLDIRHAVTRMFDRRATDRWNINLNQLSAGSDVPFGLPTASEAYGWYIGAAMTLLVLQSLVITALILQRSRRRRVEARNAAILGAAPDTMFLLTKDGLCLDYHAADPTELSTHPASFPGRRMSDVLPAGVAAVFVSAIERLVHEPGPIRVEYPMTTADGERHYEARVVRCPPDEVLAIVRDITDQKRSELALDEARADLARLSRLTALREFAASIAHEIRQPLTGILVNASTCLRWLGSPSPDLAEVRAALSDVVEAGQRANEIIRQNRELFGHHTFQLTPLDIREVVREAATLARARLQSGNVQLITDIGADVPPVYGDRVALQHVLSNLVANSLDALDGVERHSRVIEISSSLAPQGTVKMSVRDTGVGLLGVDRERLFTLAYTTKASGIGVGLAVSRSIIEAHGGRLWAEGNGVVGATFCFTLPANPAAGVT